MYFEQWSRPVVSMASWTVSSASSGRLTIDRCRHSAPPDQLSRCPASEWLQQARWTQARPTQTPTVAVRRSLNPRRSLRSSSEIYMRTRPANFPRLCPVFRGRNRPCNSHVRKREALHSCSREISNVLCVV